MSDPILNHPDIAGLANWWQAKLETTDRPTPLWWQFRLFGEGLIEDGAEIDQAIGIILTTPQGSDIHRPEFSSGIWNYIDYPLPRATPFVVRESTIAIETWEPRVRLDAIGVEATGLSRLSVTADWTIVDSAVTGTTEANFE